MDYCKFVFSSVLHYAYMQMTVAKIVFFIMLCAFEINLYLSTNMKWYHHSQNLCILLVHKVFSNNHGTRIGSMEVQNPLLLRLVVLSLK